MRKFVLDQRLAAAASLVAQGQLWRILDATTACWRPIW